MAQTATRCRGAARAAREAGGVWVPGPASAGAACERGPAEAGGTVLHQLEVLIDRLVAGSVDELDEAGVDGELAAVERAIRRLEARRCRLAAAVADRKAARAAASARQAGSDEQRARERASREATDEMAGRHRWTRSDARRNVRVGRQLGDSPGAAQEAFDAGRLPPRHAQLLADTLSCLHGEARRAAERRLVAAAEHEDAVAFGRTCRRVLAELDAAAAQHAETRRRARQRASVTPTDDGMLAISGQLAGLDAETFATAVHAFRRADAPGEHRQAGQRTADALVELARAALRAADAPAQHGVRPHVTVTIDWASVLTDAGVAETTWMGPLPYTEVRRLLADCGVARLLTDPNSAPVEAGKAVRTVPAGLWRILHERDRGCVAEGCTTPAAWCDVMHLQVPYRLNGRLTPDTAALGCRRHHRLYDLHDWRIHWHRGRPVLRPPP